MASQIKKAGKGVAIDVDDAIEHGKDVVLDVDRLDSMKKFVEEKLDSTRRKAAKPSYRPTIFRVPEDIRNIDAAAYSPKVVSIGLLQQEGLLPQEKRRLDEHKWHHLDKVLSRSKYDLGIYTQEMEDVAIKARLCYSPGLLLEAGGVREFESFIRSAQIMLLVDGCFIINLLLQLEDADGSVKMNDPIYRNRWTLPWVAHDMLLLENQLPFFVLEKLWELTAGRERPPLKTKVLQFFRNLLPQGHDDLELPETEPVHHLLHLIHLYLQPASSSRKKPESTSSTTIPGPPQPSDTHSSTKNSSFESPKSLQPTSSARISQSALSPQDEFTDEGISQAALMPHDKAYSIQSGLGPMYETRPPKAIPSATELQEAGVKFQIKKARSYLDVTFEQGSMQMPRLTISDSTNSLFRNFIAFEQGFPECGSHFTSYCIFMDSLINTPRDVEILKRAGIIEHVLGSDEEVAFLFNKLCKGTTWDFKNSYLAKVFVDVIVHSKKRWPEWRAKLVRDYFSNPWAIFSLIAAIVILILTFLQTYFGVFAYFRPP